MTPLEETDRMNAEWEGWQEWHQEFGRLTGLDINNPSCRAFVAKTRIWGELLVKLRREQPPAYSDKVIEEETAHL